MITYDNEEWIKKILKSICGESMPTYITGVGAFIDPIARFIRHFNPECTKMLYSKVTPRIIGNFEGMSKVIIKYKTNETTSGIIIVTSDWIHIGVLYNNETSNIKDCCSMMQMLYHFVMENINNRNNSCRESLQRFSTFSFDYINRNFSL